MRGAGLAWLALALLAGCQAREPARADMARQDTGEYWDEVERQRHTPLESAAAYNDEYKIEAIFPDGHPVCRGDSGGHVHGFFQWLDGDCAKEGDPSDRFLSVWADYNAMDYGWDEAGAGACGEETEPFALSMKAEGDGRLFACKPRVCGKNYVITAIYLADDAREELYKPENGPELVYTITLGTGAETEAKDLATFRKFLATLRLAGGGFAAGG